MSINNNNQEPNPANGQNVKTYDEYWVNHKIVLRYKSICTLDDSNPNADQNKKVYSALIIFNEDGVDIETKFIYDVARTEEEMNRIMKILSRVGVTPETAEDIIKTL